jgi:hypothetical protein
VCPWGGTKRGQYSLRGKKAVKLAKLRRSNSSNMVALCEGAFTFRGSRCSARKRLSSGSVYGGSVYSCSKRVIRSRHSHYIHPIISLHCVVLLVSPDVVSRHMCVCQDCAQTLRMQQNNTCPICRNSESYLFTGRDVCECPVTEECLRSFYLNLSCLVVLFSSC